MIKVLTMAALLVGFGSVSTEGAFARGGSNFGGADVSNYSIATSSFKKRKHKQGASSTHDNKRSKPKKK